MSKKILKERPKHMKKRMALLKEEYSELHKGLIVAKHDYHSFVLSTLRDNIPQSRTVVLRSFDKSVGTITFHSDIRSKKINDIKSNKNISALFYSKPRKTQIRVNGSALIEYENDNTKSTWDMMKPESKICYMGFYPPSKKMKLFDPNLPNISPYEIDDFHNSLGYKNFCRIKITFNNLEILKLNYKGHKRVNYIFRDELKAEWVAP